MLMDVIYGDLPELETDRLLLRKITLDDVQDMYAYCSDEKVAEYVTWDTHQSISDTTAFVKYALNQYSSKKVAPWGIEYKENQKLIGTIDFVSWQTNHKTAEIGYVLARDYWGRGLVTEAAKEIIKFGFNHMNLVRIQARCFEENIGSERVMEKTGMQFEGILRKAMLIKGKHRNLKMYSIIKEEINSPDRT
jgi:[ribosomal protein S5]-alanine N-acetyltransferase